MSVVVNACKANSVIAGKIVTKCKELGYDNPSLITDIEVAKQLAEFVKTLG
jgi:hypothetical protein